MVQKSQNIKIHLFDSTKWKLENVNSGMLFIQLTLAHSPNFWDMDSVAVSSSRCFSATGLDCNQLVVDMGVSATNIAGCADVVGCKMKIQVFKLCSNRLDEFSSTVMQPTHCPFGDFGPHEYRSFFPMEPIHLMNWRPYLQIISPFFVTALATLTLFTTSSCFFGSHLRLPWVIIHGWKG